MDGLKFTQNLLVVIKLAGMMPRNQKVYDVLSRFLFLTVCLKGGEWFSGVFVSFCVNSCRLEGLNELELGGFVRFVFKYREFRKTNFTKIH